MTMTNLSSNSKKPKVNSWSLVALTKNKGDVGVESQDGKAAEWGPHAAS